ncbi:Polyamine transporter-like protein [Paramyrothecium foliicola]|nr:Polyamine transporter-like protein [Paramyrothecium foliicola]
MPGMARYDGAPLQTSPALSSTEELEAGVKNAKEEQNSAAEAPQKVSRFSGYRKLHIVIAGFTCTFNGNYGSTMPSGALQAITENFQVSARLQLILLNSLYMVGYVIGPLVFGPLSEYIGRRPVLIGTYLGYLIFMLACSGAPNYAALLIFRLLCGINAAAPTTVISGLYSDIFDDPSQRGFAMALYMTVTSMGPCIAPLISAYSSQISWRWPFLVAGLIAGAGLPLVLTLPETFEPVLRNRQNRKQKNNSEEAGETGDWVEIHPFDPHKIFLRPFVLTITEPMLLATSLYLALAYSVFYLMFQAYPLVFQNFYNLDAGTAGLAYLPLLLGALLALPIFYFFNAWYDRAAKAGKQWAQREIFRRLPVACVASPCMVVSLFWLGWTPQKHIHFAVVSLNGIFMGVGFQLLFMGMTNYITDVFRQHSASAQAAASCTRSLGAVLLPLAAGSMYEELGIHWAPSLLGFAALLMGAVPFVFIKYGELLARRSKYASDIYGK